MSGRRTVSAVALDAMKANGIDTCFGIPGVHNLGLWDAMEPGRPRIIGVRHEQAAGYACDALYRATGKAGAALLTSGPGASNLVTSFGEAFSAYSPMLALASEVGLGLRRPGVTRGILHEMRDQSAMFAAFGAWTRSASSPDEVVEAVLAGIAQTLAAPTQPVYVGAPADVLEMEWPHDLPALPALPPAPFDQAALGELVATIAQSQRVVLWLGGGVNAADAEEQARSLAHRLGAVVVTSFAGRGLLAGDPHLIDAPVHEPEVSDVIAGADLLLALGSDFDAMNTRNWKMPLPPSTAVITLGSQVQNTIDWTHVVNADLRVAMPALLEALGPESPRGCWVPDAADYRRRVFDRLRADVRVAEAVAFTDALEAGWAQDDAIVADMAVCGFWATLYSHQARPRRAQYPVGWGTLGYGLPAAMGPASAGIPTLSVCGDGGAMFSLGELATFAQESLPITLLVVDDGGYGMLRFDQQAFGHPERGVDLLTPDWVALAGSFGITGVEVPDVAALPAALRAAREANGRGEPRVIVWRATLYPPRTTSPRWFEAVS